MRLGLIVITLLVVSVVIFAVTEMLPGDAAEIVMGRNATEQNLKAYAGTVGPRPPRSRPVRRLDLGCRPRRLRRIFDSKTPSHGIIGHRLLPSIYLAVFAFVIAVPSAVLVGTMAGVRPNSIGDRIVSTVGMVGISLRSL